MELFWGESLAAVTSGLDVIGVRARDQAVELQLVNGITTISQRGRYLSILPWAIGRFLHSIGRGRFDRQRYDEFLTRVEFLVLAATLAEEAPSGGALGALVYKAKLAKLWEGRSVRLTEFRRRAMLGVYLGPCRALGLVVNGREGSGVPHELTARGRAVWEAREAVLTGTPAEAFINSGTALTRDAVEASIPHFSLGSLAASGREAALLKEVLTVPWPQEDPEATEELRRSYARLSATVEWGRSLLEEEHAGASTLLARNFERAGMPGWDDTTGIAWATYECLRRIHYALELLFSALAETVRDKAGASLDEILESWAEEFEPSTTLLLHWGAATDAWSKTAEQAIASVNTNAFSGTALPTTSLGKLQPHNAVLAAFALIVATSDQSAGVREEVRRLSEMARFALDAARSNTGSFRDILFSLTERVAQAHLKTTFRKMATGQDCSLRFFVEGRQLRPTGNGVRAGESGDRLTNVLRIFTDIGHLPNIDEAAA